MGTIPLPHAIFISFLAVAFASSFTATAYDNDDDLHAIFHPLPYSAAPTPASAPAPAPSHHHHHHHNHSLSPSPAPAHHHHHHHFHHNHSISPSPAYHPSKPPTYPPVKPPSHSTVKPPSQPPVKPPSQPPVKPQPRKLVAVEGVVYCKNCSYSGVDTLMGASPLSGATVELRCRNTKYLIKKTSTTDKNGFFFLQAPKYITTYGAHKCKVYLIEIAKKSGPCSHATNLNGGVSGAFLFLNKKMAPPPKPLPYTLYSVGPFAFETPKCYKH